MSGVPARLHDVNRQVGVRKGSFWAVVPASKIGVLNPARSQNSSFVLVCSAEPSPRPGMQLKSPASGKSAARTGYFGKFHEFKGRRRTERDIFT